MSQAFILGDCEGWLPVKVVKQSGNIPRISKGFLDEVSLRIIIDYEMVVNIDLCKVKKETCSVTCIKNVNTLSFSIRKTCI